MLNVTPFPYQDEAIDRALDRGSLLIAYGMGLGKTMITMGIAEELLGSGESTLNALVVPASLKWQWAQALAWGTDVPNREIRVKGAKIVVPAPRFCTVIDGNVTKRDKQYRYIRENRPDYVIMGYNNVVDDWREVNRMQPDMIALDEATAIKSFTAQRSQQVKKWYAPYRYALTGTPIDNRADELFSIMEWVDPDALGRADLFDKSYVVRDGYGRVKRYKNLDVLHEKTKTFLVRKTRFDPDVAPHMPKDFHKDYTVRMGGKAKALYSEIATEMVEFLLEAGGGGGFDVASYYGGDAQGGGNETTGMAMSRFSALTMLCDHPALLLASANKFDADFKAEKNVITGSKYAWELMHEGKLDWIEEGKYDTPKFDAVLEQMMDVIEDSDKAKVILFSFAKHMLRLFRDALNKRGIKSVIFDGDMNSGEKEAAKMSFKRDPSVRVFLSSDAGGMGVDLPEANYLINYNHPWSAGKADQRNNRHIRAGSAWEEVFVLNFIVENSVEQWKYDVLNLKRQVGSAILDGGPTKQGVLSFDVDSLLAFVQDRRL